MKPLGEAVVDLPWIPPCASSLLGLARRACPAWESLRTDPGLLLLLVRAADPADHDRPFWSPTRTPEVLESALRLLEEAAPRPLPWSYPGPRAVWEASVRRAALAAVLAEAVPGTDVERAWCAGFLASLGGLAAAVLEPGCETPANDWDPLALGRRLAHRWNLPGWLGAVVGHLSLPCDLAVRLGADAAIFRIVQLAAAFLQEATTEGALPVGADLGELAVSLGLDAARLEGCGRRAEGQADSLLQAQRAWQCPTTQPLLADMLRLALDNRRGPDRSGWERCQEDLDRLHGLLEETLQRQEARLHQRKLTALAELAAGAGHEINNPLAVISGQAQYLLRQLHLTDLSGDDQEASSVEEEWAGKIRHALQTIVGQTQRIHHVLTDLIHFARPAPPTRISIGAADLLAAAVAAVESLAADRKVHLAPESIEPHWRLLVDAEQIRLALVALLRNAIEASPTDGRVDIRCREDPAGFLEIQVEDGGPGLSPLVRDHLFDPFFSGRSAGRGRGLGLPIAWRYAQQNGGDVRYLGRPQGRTRFALVVPGPEMEPASLGLPLPEKEPAGSLAYAS